MNGALPCLVIVVTLSVTTVTIGDIGEFKLSYVNSVSTISLLLEP